MLGFSRFTRERQLQFQREIRHDRIEAFMDDVLELLEYAKEFPPQNI